MIILGKKNKDPQLTAKFLQDSDSTVYIQINGQNKQFNGGGGGIANFTNSSFTIPIPYDEDGDALTLIVDINENGEFKEEDGSDSQQILSYTRINMSNFRDKMKIFSNGQVVPIPDTGIGIPYYGETIMFTIDNEMFPGYVAGNKYFGRYRWYDSRAGVGDWNGFVLTYDFEDCRPVKIKIPEEVKIYNTTLKNYDESDSTVASVSSIDYLNGEIQYFSLSGSAIINSSNIYNIPFGKVLCVIVEKTGTGTLKIIDGTSTMNYTANKKYMIGVMNIGTLFVSVSESI